MVKPGWYSLAALNREDPVLSANYSADVCICHGPVMSAKMTVTEQRCKSTIYGKVNTA